MKDFQIDVKERLDHLIKTNALSNKKTQFQKAYLKALIDDDWNEVTEIDEFQTAFLDLFNERYPVLFKSIQEPLELKFYELFKDSEEESERNYKAQSELIMHSVQVPSTLTDEWQFMFEMKSSDTIFHVEFKGWSFKNIGITH